MLKFDNLFEAPCILKILKKSAKLIYNDQQKIWQEIRIIMRIFCKYHIWNNLALGQIPEKLNFDSICVYFANITFATNPQLLGTMFKSIKRQHLCNTLATDGFAASALQQRVQRYMQSYLFAYMQRWQR